MNLNWVSLGATRMESLAPSYECGLRWPPFPKTESTFIPTRLSARTESLGSWRFRVITAIPVIEAPGYTDSMKSYCLMFGPVICPAAGPARSTATSTIRPYGHTALRPIRIHPPPRLLPLRHLVPAPHRLLGRPLHLRRHLLLDCLQLRRLPPLFL